MPNRVKAEWKNWISPAETVLQGVTVKGGRLAARIADLLMPPLCLACQYPLSVHDSLCAACWRDVGFITHPLCDRLGIPLPFDPGGPSIISAAAAADPPSYDRARAATHFSGVSRDLIHRFKYADQQTPRQLFHRWLTSCAQEFASDCDIVIPVPLHYRRLRARRFNQSAILAQDLARVLQLDYEPSVLQRQRRTISQVGLTRDQRRRNLQGAFAMSATGATMIFGRGVLLVDVITTGTTIDACARVLKRAGAGRVDVVALAIVTEDSRIDP